MTRAFPPILGALIPRLGSPFDHEVVATARAIDRTLRSNGLDWHDLTKSIIAPLLLPRPPHPTDSCDPEEMRAWLTAISREDWINEWTARFVGDLLRRRSLDKLSERQLACIERIVREAFNRSVRPEREAA